MRERDPALLPGPTAGEWLGRARLALAVGTSVPLLTLLAAGFGAELPPPVLLVAGVVAVAGFAGWVLAGGRAVRQMSRERQAGYATAADVPGLALRHPLTGELERPAETAPSTEDDVPLVRRLLRVSAGSVLDRPRPPD